MMSCNCKSLHYTKIHNISSQLRLNVAYTHTYKLVMWCYPEWFLCLNFYNWLSFCYLFLLMWKWANHRSNHYVDILWNWELCCAYIVNVSVDYECNRQMSDFFTIWTKRHSQFFYCLVLKPLQNMHRKPKGVDRLYWPRYFETLSLLL